MHRRRSGGASCRGSWPFKTPNTPNLQKGSGLGLGLKLKKVPNLQKLNPPKTPNPKQTNPSLDLDTGIELRVDRHFQNRRQGGLKDLGVAFSGQGF